MTDSRWIVLLALMVALPACARAPVAPPPQPLGTPLPELEEADVGSAAIEEAGLDEDTPEEPVPHIEVEEVATPYTPAGFLYPGDGALPPPVQRQVEQFVHAFTEGRARETYRRWLEREAVWGDWIRSELRSAELPEDLLYLAMIESGFHTTAVSHAGATGMWQFMPATARLSGLRVDDWVDERRDPVAATRAAIRHLSELHAATGDWALSAAAYNAGLGRVSRARAAQRGGQTDYFSLSMAERLPRETRNYVPLILAAAWVATNREDYGLPPREAGAPPTATPLAVEGRVRLSVLADGLGIPRDTLAGLNRHLLRGAVPPSGGTVSIPAGADTTGLGTYLAGLPQEQRLLPDWIETRYAVKGGDSWWAIARRHGTTVDRLRALNPRRGEVIHPGDRLIVRRVAAYDTGDRVIAGATTTAVSGPAPASTTARRAPASSRPATTRATSAGAGAAAGAGTVYTVRSGDTMSGIAKRIGVPLATLAEWNGMAAPRPLRTGEVLRVAAPVIRYVVQPGDTMTALARRYEVSVADLAEWNAMKQPRPLRAGETLLVRSAAN